MADTATTSGVTIVPANEASWEDLQAVFGTRGDPSRCDGEPVGWCAVEPRTAHPRLLLKTRVPWAGRAEDRATTASGP